MAGRSARASRRPSITVFGFAARIYFRLLSRAAHAWGTPESAALLPGITAQPPFSTYAPRFQVLTFFSSVRLLAESALCWNWSTQIGAMAATTALLAVLSAKVFAVLPSMNPPQLNPMPSVANAPRAAPCRSFFQRFSLVPSRCWHETILPIYLGKKDSSPPNMARQIINSGPVFALQGEQ
jgi:hypothetical protein